MKRRDFTALLGRAGALGSMSPGEAAAQTHDMPAGLMPPAAKQTVAMLVVPRMTAMDLIGPQLILASLMNIDVQLVWKTREAVVSDTGVSINPSATFADIAEPVTLLFVPGGTSGTFAMMNDPDVIAFLTRIGRSATYVTSVCTGSMILAASGLLRGYQATSHWVMRDLLATMGAIPVDRRVVVDRNRITGAGVTAGLDFGLTVASILRSEAYARSLQLAFEYDPHPPFDSGSPARASAETTAQMRTFYAPAVTAARNAASVAAARLARTSG